MKNTLLALLLLLPTAALADTVQLNWLAPTEREDNTPLLPEEIAAYEVRVNGINRLTVPGTNTGVLFDITDPGLHNITIITVDTEGRHSIEATAVTYNVVANPKQATGLTIQRIK